MTEEEILKLSGEELRIKAAEAYGYTDVKVEGNAEKMRQRADFVTGFINGGRSYVPEYSIDIRDAMTLFNEVYNPMSKIRHGAWVLSTVDEGKDCSLATLFFGAPSRRARRQGRKNRPLKARAKAKKKQMARAITLCYVMAMEGATVDLRYQSEEA